MTEQQDIDEIAQMMGLVVEAITEGHEIPLYGKVVALTPNFITLERRDKTRTVINLKSIRTISPTRFQPRVV
jgi:BRCT domain type II-containing protein